MHRVIAIALLFAVAFAAHRAAAADGPVYGPELQGFDYGFPVADFSFSSQRQTLHMAYIDVHPKNFNGKVAVLLHGKNFCAATWRTSIEALSAAGYRVIAPDQIGFCKSSKPERYQFTFQQLARNTHALLASLNITSAILIAHSTGGMIAVRYALMYPSETALLALVDPIGLEDWKAKGVPSVSVDEWYAQELKTNADSIRRYETDTYYAGHWSADYEPWVQMLAGLNAGPGKEAVAWDSALLYDMIYTQPIFYELEKLSMPTLLIVGDKDNTAIGKQFAPPQIKPTLGHYPQLAKAAAQRIPHSTLVEFTELGHAPQIQDAAAFHQALFTWLKANAGKE